jgi:hypothetical protein
MFIGCSPLCSPLADLVDRHGHRCVAITGDRPAAKALGEIAPADILAPSVSRVALLDNPANPGTATQLRRALQGLVDEDRRAPKYLAYAWTVAREATGLNDLTCSRRGRETAPDGKIRDSSAIVALAGGPMGPVTRLSTAITLMLGLTATPALAARQFRDPSLRQ